MINEAKTGADLWGRSGVFVSLHAKFTNCVIFFT